MHDGASVHTAKTTCDWLKKHSVKMFNDGEWPAQSPDLNIVEHIWPFVSKTLEDQVFANVEDLWAGLQVGFAKVTQQQVLGLYGSMQRRLAAVLVANGAHTKY